MIQPNAMEIAKKNWHAKVKKKKFSQRLLQKKKIIKNQIKKLTS